MIRRAAVAVDRWHGLVLLLAAPFFLFPSPVRSLALLVLPGLWLAAWLAGRPPLPRTPFNGVLLLFSLMLLVSLWTTFDLVFSLPKTTGVLLGLAAFFAIVRQVRGPAAVWQAALLFILSGGGLVLLGLLGIQWVDKVPLLNAITDRFPAVIRGLPGAEEGISANGVAGALIFIIPIQLMVLGTALAQRPRLPAADPLAARPRLWWTAHCLLLALTGGLLFLSQSRSAWLGCAVALGLLLAWRGRRMRWALVGLAVGGGVLVFLLGGLPAALSLAERAIGSDVSLKAVQREQLWRFGLLAVRDYPLTGMGLNTFRKALPVLYAIYEVPLDYDFVHAHNHLIQAAIDLGLPGLVAFLALWWGAAAVLFKAQRATADPWLRALTQGLGAGLAAEFVYGLTDVISLGAKLGIFFWFVLALSVCLYQATTGANAEKANESRS